MMPPQSQRLQRRDAKRAAVFGIAAAVMCALLPPSPWLTLPSAAAQGAPGGKVTRPSEVIRGVPCSAVQQLDVPFTHISSSSGRRRGAGARCSVSRGPSSSNEMRGQVSDIIGHGIHRAMTGATAGYGAVARGYRDDEAFLGNPYNDGGELSSFSGKTIGPYGRRHYHHRHLFQMDDNVDSVAPTGNGRIITCPIDVRDIMLNQIASLAAPCSVSVEQNDGFCQNCLRVLQVKLADQYHSSKLEGRHSYVVPLDKELAAINACAEDALFNLEDIHGVSTSEDTFIVNVLLCKSFHEDSRCPIPTEDLIAKNMDGMLCDCDTYLLTQVESTDIDTAIMNVAFKLISRAFSNIWDFVMGRSNAEPMKSNAGEPPYALSVDDASGFCSSCYYPFYRILMKETLSKQSWCKFAEMATSDGTVGNATTMESFQASLMQDDQFLSCMLNVMYYLEYYDQDKMNPFGASNQMDMVRNVCWLPEHQPNVSWHSKIEWERVMERALC